MVNAIELTVADALVTDSGRSIARIDSKSRQALGISTGDVIEIKGKARNKVGIEKCRKCGSIYMRAKRKDWDS